MARISITPSLSTQHGTAHRFNRNWLWETGDICCGIQAMRYLILWPYILARYRYKRLGAGLPFSKLRATPGPVSSVHLKEIITAFKPTLLPTLDTVIRYISWWDCPHASYSTQSSPNIYILTIIYLAKSSADLLESLLHLMPLANTSIIRKRHSLFPAILLGHARVISYLLLRLPLGPSANRYVPVEIGPASSDTKHAFSRQSKPLFILFESLRQRQGSTIRLISACSIARLQLSILALHIYMILKQSWSSSSSRQCRVWGPRVTQLRRRLFELIPFKVPAFYVSIQEMQSHREVTVIISIYVRFRCTGLWPWPNYRLNRTLT